MPLIAEDLKRINFNLNGSELSALDILRNKEHTKYQAIRNRLIRIIDKKALEMKNTIDKHKRKVFGKVWTIDSDIDNELMFDYRYYELLKSKFLREIKKELEDWLEYFVEIGKLIDVELLRRIKVVFEDKEISVYDLFSQFYDEYFCLVWQLPVLIKEIIKTQPSFLSFGLGYVLARIEQDLQYYSDLFNFNKENPHYLDWSIVYGEEISFHPAKRKWLPSLDDYEADYLESDWYKKDVLGL